MVTIFLSDLDGTLLNSSGKVSDASADMLNKAISSQKLFSVATARSYDTAAELMKSINTNAPAVLLNGALICDLNFGKIYHYSDISPQTASMVFNIFNDHGRTPFCYFLKNKDNAASVTLEYISPATPFDKEFIEECENIGSSIERVDNFDFERPALYFTAMDTEKIVLPIYKTVKDLPGCDVTLYRDTYHDGYWFLDIFAAGTSKANGALMAKKIVCADIMTAFGDNLNDIPMLNAADCAVAVSNAADEVKEICDEIIGSNDDDAVAKYILNYSL
mgnify:CR=1 FL=1